MSRQPDIASTTFKTGVVVGDLDYEVFAEVEVGESLLADGIYVRVVDFSAFVKGQAVQSKALLRVIEAKLLDEVEDNRRDIIERAT